MSIESINRKLPEEVVRQLIEDKLLRQPSEITDSAEDALLLPEFGSIDEFDALIARIDQVSHELAEDLRLEAERLRAQARNGNGQHGASSNLT